MLEKYPIKNAKNLKIKETILRPVRINQLTHYLTINDQILSNVAKGHVAFGNTKT